MTQAVTTANAPQPATDGTVHHVSARKRRALPPAKMQPNLSSMIDVIFQLLIYFVITANFAVGEGVITAKLPAADSGAAQAAPPERPLNIVISAAGQYGYRLSIEGTPQAPRDYAELATLLRQLNLATNPGGGAYKDDNPVLIKPEGTVRWQHVVNAFNAAIRARFKNVSFSKVTEQ